VIRDISELVRPRCRADLASLESPSAWMGLTQDSGGLSQSGRAGQRSEVAASRSRRALRPSFARRFLALGSEGAGKTGARCTRGLVCNCARKYAHEHTVAAEASGLPCAMALRLMAGSPRRRVLVVTVVGGLKVCPARSGRRASTNLTSATDARTTRFCRTLQRRSSRVLPIAHGPFASPPCDHVGA
jgi:hypothetical protein